MRNNQLTQGRKGKKSKEKSKLTAGSEGRSQLCVHHMQMVDHIFKSAGQNPIYFFSVCRWKSLFKRILWWPNHMKDTVVMTFSWSLTDPMSTTGHLYTCRHEDQKHMGLRAPSAVLSTGTGVGQFSCTVFTRSADAPWRAWARAEPAQTAAKEDNRLRWGWSSVPQAQLRHLSSPTVTLDKSFNLSFWLLYLQKKGL